MIKSLNFLSTPLLLLFSCFHLHSQEIQIDAVNGQTITDCIGTFTDSGGSGSDYGSNEDYTVTFYSGSPCMQVILEFTSFITESGYDYLRIYDGPDNTYPTLFTELGGTSPGTISSTSNYLTIRFTSDGSVTNAGWVANILTCSALTYSPGCYSASPTTYITNADFSFSVPPIDGATIDNATGFISNGTPGTTYYVTDACSGNSATVILGTDNPCYDYNGDAQLINVSGENCIQLTPAINNMTGCAWSKDKIDFSNSFNLSLDYYFGVNPAGADGTTFTFQPNLGVCGDNGGQLGAGGLSQALIIEFDTYDNDNPSNNDLACDHVAVEIDGGLVVTNGSPAPLCGPSCASATSNEITDGVVHEVSIQWDATTQTLDIYFDGDLRLTCVNDFISTVFGGQNMVYWGATAATGGLNNQQYFCPQTVVLPSELIHFESTCSNDEETIHWSTATENNVDYFNIEYTLDGLTFYSVGIVDAVGESQEIQNYRLEITEKLPKNRYYRLSTYDLDGNYKASDLIVSNSCEPSDLIQIANFNNNQLNIGVSEENVSIKVFDLSGRVIANELIKQQHLLQIPISAGSYIIQAINSDKTKVKSRKIVAF